MSTGFVQIIGLLLYELVPDFEPWCEESKDALEWALKEGRVLRGEEE